MRVQIDLPDYQESEGIQTTWEEGFTIAVQIDPAGAVLLQADRAGLISLARHLLTLAQEAAPVGSHVYLVDLNCKYQVFIQTNQRN